MKKYSTVIFDVDGVLLDSLAPHLQICRDKNKEYGLGLAIPDADEFRSMVRNNRVKISPMNFFFKAVGFPEKYAEMAFSQYKKVFMRDYAPQPFPGVDEMLSALASAGFNLGIVTSNVRANVDAALGSNMLFNPQCIFTMENSDSLPKKDALSLIAKKLNVNPVKLIYVGDQPADWLAAQEAGTDFLGVSYGWGISKEDKEFPVVNTVNGISEYLLNG